MEANTEANTKRGPSLVDQICHLGELAYDPELSLGDRDTNQKKFHDLIQRTGVLALMPVLNLLIQPGRCSSWLRPPLISILAMLPLRDRGVQNTIEFVLSVHPSNSSFDGSKNGKRGFGMSHEALQAASRLLSTPPRGITPEKWFSSVAPQLLSLLEGEGEPEMDRAAAFIIGFGILGRKQYGAPGSPGWTAFVEPMLHNIDPSIALTLEDSTTTTDEGMITLGQPEILVSSDEIAKNLQRLTVLVTSHPHPSLTRRLLRPILLPLWSLCSWSSENEVNARHRKPARKLLKIFLQLSSDAQIVKSPGRQEVLPKNLSMIVQNLMFRGNLEHAELAWIYAASRDGGIQIQVAPLEVETQVPDFTAVGQAASSFIDLIKSTPDLDNEISGLFVDLCSKRFNAETKSSTPEIRTHARSDQTSDDVETIIVVSTILQKLLTELPDKLVNDSQQVLELVDQVLHHTSDVEGADSEDDIAVALSLLNLVLTSPSFRESTENRHLLESIQVILEKVGRSGSSDISSTARNLVMLMKIRRVVEAPGTPSSTIETDQRLEDRKSYSLAMSYLTATDSPPPVRVQGLQLVSNLIQTNSAILDIPALLVLFASLLQDEDEYIFLRAIKCFTELSERHPKAVMKDLIDRYTDPNEDYGLDQRLRLGEALLQVVEKSSRIFAGEIASYVTQGLFSIAGRRGLRPKSEKEQEKKDRLKKLKNKEAENAWDGEVPQLDELLDVQAESDYEVVSQIVSGWESKRGSEDVRMRTSAMSILAVMVESHVAELGSNLVSTAVDLSIHILTLEPEREKGILRRSATLLIMGFIRALDAARAEGRKLGFGLVGQSLDEIQRILIYVRDTDNDGLVQEHARDVVESLQAWQLHNLLPAQRDQGDLHELAGLSVSPGEISKSSTRPRIEEIE